MGMYTPVVKMENKEITNLAGAGGQAPEEEPLFSREERRREGAGATPKSPIYLLEEVRKIAKQMSNSEFESLVEKVYKLAVIFHEKYCDYPCFTSLDVKAFLSVEEDEPFVIEDEGTSIVTKSGTFGNLSYSHFLDSVYYAIEEMLKSPVLVRVVQAHNINLHLKNLDTGKSTKITVADELVLTKSLVDYVIENGKQSTREQWGYSRIAHSRVKYTNKVYSLMMVSSEVLSRLKITPRNRRCFALQRILEVLGLEVEE